MSLVSEALTGVKWGLFVNQTLSGIGLCPRVMTVQSKAVRSAGRRPTSPSPSVGNEGRRPTRPHAFLSREPHCPCPQGGSAEPSLNLSDLSGRGCLFMVTEHVRHAKGSNGLSYKTTWV